MATKALLSAKQFKVLVEQDEDGFFVATVPVLPGCHAQAKSLPELTVRVRDAIRLCLAVAKENPAYRVRLRRFAYQPSFVGVELVTV